MTCFYAFEIFRRHYFFYWLTWLLPPFSTFHAAITPLFSLLPLIIAIIDTPFHYILIIIFISPLAILYYFHYISWLPLLTLLMIHYWYILAIDYADIIFNILILRLLIFSLIATITFDIDYYSHCIIDDFALPLLLFISHWQAGW
jgi:hypothetical protein